VSSLLHSGDNLWKNILFTIIALLIVFLIAEIFVRVFIPSSDQLWETDQYIGMKLKPNNEGYWISSEYKTLVKTNSDGFRDREYSIEKPVDTYRIVVLGDSYTEALQVDFEKTFHELLEQKENVEIISFGVSGQGTAQHYLTLKNYAQKYQSDLVIDMFLVGNDIHDNSFELNQRKDRPYFDLDENKNLIEGTEFTQGGDIRSSWIKTIVMENSKLCSLLFKSVYKIFSVSEACPSEYGIYMKKYNENWENAWEITEKTLQEINKESSEFLIVVLDNTLLTYQTSTVACDYELDPQHPNDKIKEICEQNEFNCLHLTLIFKENYEKTGKTGHWEKDGHWNEIGHQWAADAIFDKLINENFIKG